MAKYGNTVLDQAWNAWIGRSNSAVVMQSKLCKSKPSGLVLLGGYPHHSLKWSHMFIMFIHFSDFRYGAVHSNCALLGCELRWRQKRRKQGHVVNRHQQLRRKLATPELVIVLEAVHTWQSTQPCDHVQSHLAALPSQCSYLTMEHLQFLMLI